MADVGAACGWRCSGRCGAGRRRAGGRPGPEAPSGARPAGAGRGARRSPSTTWSTRCGRPSRPSPARRRCTPTSPGCAPTSGRPRPAGDAGRRLPAAARRRRAGPRAGPDAAAAARCRAPHDPGGALAVLRRGARAVARAGPRRPRPTSRRSRPPIEECAQLHREVTDALVASAVDAGRPPTSSTSRPPRSPPTRCASPRCCCSCGRWPRPGGRRRRCTSAASSGSRLAEETGLDPSPALGRARARHRRRRSRSACPPAPVRLAARPADPADRPRRPRWPRCTGCSATERLVTLVGPGGVGKTRAGPGGRSPRAPAATVLLLAPVTDPAAIPHALAAALELTSCRATCSRPASPCSATGPGCWWSTTASTCSTPSATLSTTLLAACPRLTVLATSREPLGLPAEYTFRLAPLPLPGASRTTTPAHVAVRRASSSSGPPGCARPGADRGGAAHSSPTSCAGSTGCRWPSSSPPAGCPRSRCADLHDRLDRSLDLLGGGRPTGDARHRTLRATVEWSYQLLSPTSGGCSGTCRSSSTASTWTPPSGSPPTSAWPATPGRPRPPGRRLDDRRRLRGRTRYRMLETLRAFGLDRLAAAGEDDDAADRHAALGASRLTAGSTRTWPPSASPRRTRRCAGSCRTCAPRGGWPAAAARSTTRRAIVAALFDAIAYRDLVEIRGWAEELAADPALAAHPRGGRRCSAPRPRPPTTRGRLRGGRPARPHRARAGDGRPSAAGTASSPLVGRRPGRGAATPRPSSTPWPRRRPPTAPRLGVAALAAVYAGDLDARAARLHDAGLRRRGLAHRCARGPPTSPGRSRTPPATPDAAERALPPRHRAGPRLRRHLPGRRRDRRVCSPPWRTRDGSRTRCAATAT